MNEQFTEKLSLPLAKIKAAVAAIELDLNRPDDDAMNYFRIGYFVGELSRSVGPLSMDSISLTMALFNPLPGTKNRQE